MDYSEINRLKWNCWSLDDCVWTRPITHEEYLSAQKGELPIYLTPLKAVPKSWISNLSNKDVLCLASGGGQQCPFFVAHGANVTVFDISEQQLLAEYNVAEREGYKIEIIQGDMTKGLPFDDESFDIIFNPVSTSYIDDLAFFWKECSRVLRNNGIIMTGCANPTIYLFDQLSSDINLKYCMPFNPLNELSYEEQNVLFSTDGIQFGHSFDEQIGELVRSGLVIKDFYEDYHPSNNKATNYETRVGRLAASLTKYMPIYFAVLAQKLTSI